jgi:hypothetical protein
MGHLDRIRAVNARDMTRFRPFLVGRERYGWVRHDLAALLGRFPRTFFVRDASVTLSPRLRTPTERTAAVEEALLRLHGEGRVPGWRGERYPVLRRWGERPAMAIERAAAPMLGVKVFGVHLNGYVKGARSLRIWVGRRSLSRPTSPGKLDHLAAGGQPVGLSLRENLAKECAEEAGMPASLARKARPVGALTYVLEADGGLRDDTLFVYDLEVPRSFRPRNVDGEIDSFHLWPARKVVETVRDTEEFKFNVAPVLIDFFVRHGLLTPDEPDYVEIVRTLRS